MIGTGVDAQLQKHLPAQRVLWQHAFHGGRNDRFRCACQPFVEPLKELVFNTPRSAGFLEHWVSTFKLFCTVYDPNSDRYRFDYSIFTAIVVGLLSLGLIAVFIVREWRRAR